MISNRAFIWVIIATVAFLLGPYLWFHTRSIPVDSPGEWVVTDFEIRVRKEYPIILTGTEVNSILVWLDQKPDTISPVVKVDGEAVPEFVICHSAYLATKATTGTWVIQLRTPQRASPPEEVTLTIDGQERTLSIHSTTSARKWTTRVFWLYEYRPMKYPPMLRTNRFEESEFRQELQIPDWCTHAYVRNLPGSQKVMFGRVGR